jgi:hypothetical protein
MNRPSIFAKDLTNAPKDLRTWLDQMDAADEHN